MAVRPTASLPRHLERACRRPCARPLRHHRTGVPLRDVYLRVTSLVGGIHSAHDRGQSALYARPTGRRKHDHGNATCLQVLLIFETEIGADQHLESVAFSGVEQFAILEGGPPTLVCSGDIVVRQCLAQRNWGALIEKNPHLCRSQSAPSGMFKNFAGLCDGHPRKPLHEL